MAEFLSNVSSVLFNQPSCLGVKDQFIPTSCMSRASSDMCCIALKRFPFLLLLAYTGRLSTFQAPTRKCSSSVGPATSPKYGSERSSVFSVSVWSLEGLSGDVFVV